MIIRLDESMIELGMEKVVLGIAKNVDPNAELSQAFLDKQKKMEEWALACDLEDVMEDPIIQGYFDRMKSVGRSIKKNRPSAPALIRNIKSRGAMPHINSIVDIYNVESLKSLLAIGGHDLDKVNEFIEFTVSGKEDIFLPILSTKKHVAETDYLYKDAKGVMAWIDARDGENYKFDDDTKNAIFIIQGNRASSAKMRLEALERIASDMKECMPNLEFKSYVASVGETEIEI